MPKRRPLPRLAFDGTTRIYDDAGSLSGTWLRPGTVGQGAVRADTFSGKVGYLGTVYGGTVYVGDEEGQNPVRARLVLGYDAKGLMLSNRQGETFAVLTWGEEGQDPYVRIGYEDRPNIYMDDEGNLWMHGDCVIDGTLTASKIVLGDAWVRTMLAGGLLAIGTGDGETPDNPADPFSGFRVSHKTASASGKGTVWQRRAKAAGFYEGAMTFAIDTATGEFLSLGADESEDTYISLKQGVWTIANDETVPNGAGVTKLLFRTKHQSFGTEMVSDFYMHGSPSGLILYRPNTMQQPAIELWMDREEGGVTTRQVVTRYGCEILHMAVIPYARDPNWFDIWVRGDAVWLSTMRRRLVVQADLETEDGDVKIAGAQRWIQNSAGEWPALPDAGPAERILMPDSTTGDLKYWNGTAWTTVTTS